MRTSILTITGASIFRALPARRIAAASVLVVALAPILAIASVFPSSGVEPYEPWANAVYNPTWADWGIMAGSFGWFFMWFLLFVKNFPAVSISEVKEVLDPPKRQAARAATGAGGKRT